MENKGYKKSREFKRKTVCKTLEDFLIRCEILKTFKKDKNNALSYYNVKDVVVFGSFVNSDKEKVHDLDLNIVLEKSDLTKSMSREELASVAYRLAPDNCNMVLKVFWLSEAVYKYLKNKSPIISVNVEDINQLSGRKVKVIENGVLCLENIKTIFHENGYKSEYFE